MTTNNTKICKKYFVQNLKNNRKLSVMIVLICIVLGIVAGIADGVIYQKKYIERKQTDCSNAVLKLNDIKKDAGYYYNALFELKMKYNSIQAYVSYFKNVDLNDTDVKKIDDIQEKLNSYSKQYNNLYSFFINMPLAYNNDSQSTIEYYQSQCELLQEKKHEEKQELQELMDGNYTQSYKTTKENVKHNNIKNIEKNIDAFSTVISLLKDATTDTIKVKNVEYERLLEDNVKTLNSVIEQFNTALAQIADEENYMLIYNEHLLDVYLTDLGIANEVEFDDILSVHKDQAIIYAKSTYSIDQKKDRIIAIITFTLLFGGTLSILVGGLYNSKKDEINES